VNPETETNPPAPHRHLWPWIVLAFVLLGVLLAVVWVRHEVLRLQWQKEVALPESSASPTNSPH